MLDELEESSLKFIDENFKLVQNAKVFLNDFLNQNEELSDFESETKKTVDRFVRSYLDNIEKSIVRFCAEEKINHIFRMREYLSFLIDDKKMIAEITNLRKRQEELTFENIENFKKVKIRDYFVNSPKEMFEKIRCLNSIIKEDAINNLKIIIIQKYDEHISNKISEDPNSLDFRALEQSLNFLPDDLKSMIQYMFDQKKDEIRRNIENEEKNLKRHIRQKDFERIATQYEMYSANNQKENMKRIEVAIYEKYILKNSQLEDNLSENFQFLNDLNKYFSEYLPIIKNLHEDCVKTIETRFEKSEDCLLKVSNLVSFETNKMEQHYDLVVKMSKIDQFEKKFQYINRILQDFFKNLQKEFNEALEKNDIPKILHSLDLMGNLRSIAQKCLNQSSEPYVQMKNKAEDKIQALITELTGINLIHNETDSIKFKKEYFDFFGKLNLKYLLLNELINSLKKHLKCFDSLETKCIKSLENKINSLINEKLMTNLENILKQTSLPSDVNEFFCSYFNILAFEQSMTKGFSKPKNIEKLCNKRVLKEIDELSICISTNSDLKSIAYTLVVIKNFSNKIFIFKKDIDEKLNKILNNLFKKNENFNLIAKLAQSLKVDPIGSLIVSEHKCFEAFHHSLFNRKTLSQNIKYVLEQITGDECDKSQLESSFSSFNSIYEKLITEYLQPKINFTKFMSNLQMVIQKVTNASQFKWDSSIKKKIPEIVAYIFALWTLLNVGSYFESGSERTYLFLPHPSQVIAIFRLIGIGYKQGFLDKAISFTGLKGDELLHSNLVQIGTGEGKSVTLAVTAAVLSLFNCDVCCVCFSDYLSQRDFAIYKPLFDQLKVSDHISYGTFNFICEEAINKNGNIRAIVKNLFQNECFQGKKHLQRKNSGPRVLLIDEVDVFFSKEFYGNSYNPIVQIEDKTIDLLIRHIWDSRANVTLSSLKSTDEYEACIERFSQWKELIEEACKDMLSDLKKLDSHEYIVKEEKIGYTEHDGISFSTYHGYKTLFAYFIEHEKGSISKNSLEEKIRIQINVGSFSYAQIPIENFISILGVTGTLATLNETQKDIIENIYNIKHKTFSPSIYGRNNLRFDPKLNVSVEEKNNHYKVIVQEIKQKIVGQNIDTKRAVFVVLESISELKEFYNSDEFLPLKSDSSILTEEASSEEKVNIINNSTISGKITLLTKIFGRGTDFIVHDEIVSVNEGVHVVQTFLSEDYSEEIQIRGRAARQGEYGSYSLIVSVVSLEKFLITPEDILKNETNLYDFLDEKRRKFFNLQYNENIKYVSNIKDGHELSIEFLYSLKEADLLGVKRFLLEQNIGSVMDCKSKTMILLDATGSMHLLIDKTKKTLELMFQRVNEILTKNNFSQNSFQIKIAIFRNYNSPEDRIYQASAWENKPNNLIKFLNGIKALDGNKNEAIEIALSQANLETSLSQIILIGDAPPNSLQDIETKRMANRSIWENSKLFRQPTHYKSELNKLKRKRIPVHAFYLTEKAKNSFVEISSQTNGKSAFLDITSHQGSETLTNLVNVELLKNIGGIQRGADLVDAYNKIYTL